MAGLTLHQQIDMTRVAMNACSNTKGTKAKLPFALGAFKASMSITRDYPSFDQTYNETLADTIFNISDDASLTDEEKVEIIDRLVIIGHEKEEYKCM